MKILNAIMLHKDGESLIEKSSIIENLYACYLDPELALHIMTSEGMMDHTMFLFETVKKLRLRK